MIKINLVVVGKIKESYYRDAVNEYLKRLSSFARVSLVEIKEENTPLEADVKKTLETEGKAILAKAKGKIFALAIEGEKLDSTGLAVEIKKRIDAGDEITFVIGSSRGLADFVKKEAFKKLSFSDMTFPHALARVMLAEQLYRAFTIINGTGYHK